MLVVDVDQVLGPFEKGCVQKANEAGKVGSLKARKDNVAALLDAAHCKLSAELAALLDAVDINITIIATTFITTAIIATATTIIVTALIATTTIIIEIDKATTIAFIYPMRMPHRTVATFHGTCGLKLFH